MKRKTRTIVALLTGRGNNTLKDKNVRRVLGKPVLYYPASAARRSRHITHFFVSSDDNKILEAASRVGFRKIKRPAIYARPNSKHVDTIWHAVSVMREQGVVPDILIVLLANCVTTKTEWIDRSIEKILKDNSISAVVPVNLVQDHHPYRAKRLDKKGFLEPYFDFSGQSISTNRQDLAPNYFLCHNFWVLNVRKSLYSKHGQPPWTFMGNRIKPYVVEETFDVHDRNDLRLSARWVKDNREA